MKLEYILGIVVLVAIAVGAGIILKPGMPTDTKNTVETTTLTASEKASQFKKYTEIANPSGFLNSDGKAIKLSDYVGKKVILLDFLTYSCINCQRTFPYLTKWDDAYGQKGLEIIAIHTPEFAFEHDPKNVQKALDGFGIKFPVVLDNDYGTWNAYGNQYWPRKYLIDIDGYVVYDHIGEGEYDVTEQKIVDLLNERAERLGTDPVALGGVADSISNTAPSSNISPETYIGTERGAMPAGSGQKCTNGVCVYTEPETVPADTYALAGIWKRDSEYTTLQSDTGSLSYTFHAKKVHLVASSANGSIATLYIDGKPITANQSGSDVVDGKVSIGKATLYTLVDLGSVTGTHTLDIRFSGAGVQVYTLTFS
jgi:thiol-disulfide isomerase/thioredoxin